ncbi:NACHT domain-containing protein [Actinophytocola algeriensis]|uniref:Uncharacterized protein n=1 Tax=Actinophytocola algeriensis TaxID=1768010 RepID=A0A7W7QBT5_9PSEU|nr:ATP-binding protein [Actinophytocola algeriensis]MBB4910689.1 hypothetical protein [Actinophytocola algeriensis]MBE1473682.1 hypothetical protein [Actinophytocola algeriensis]
MTQLPEINWRQIRGKSPSGSQRDGFEELANQLMIFGDLVTWPPDTKFSVFGNPDGGREGRGELPGGVVWAWQAKYLFELDSDEFGQITKSVRRVLETEPTLERYFVLLPCNPPAGDTAQRKSAWTKWNEYVAKWQGMAEAAGRTVAFEYVGETQLNSCLLQASQVGRLRYWFDLDTFSEDRFRAIAARAEADAGGRYTPELNVKLPIAAVFDGLARTPAFEHDIRLALAALRNARGTYGLSAPDEQRELFEPAIWLLEDRLDRLEEAVADAIAQARRPHGVLPDLKPFMDALEGPIHAIVDLLREHCLRDGYYIGNAGSLHHQISSIESAISGLYGLRAGRAWQSFDQTTILVTGTGGAGKTHLLCDLAKTRTANNLPTIIVLGEQFERGPIETDLGRIIGFNSPAGQLLATFEAACQTTGTVGLIIIDGLNEPADRKLWNKYLHSFLNDAAGYPHIRLVLSCRTEFLADTLSDPLQERLRTFQHTGFAEVSRDAIRQFLDWYGIERPSFPLLDPEFTNPLFLKLLCTTLQTRGEHRFPRTGFGTSWIYDSFLDAINDRLADPERCDYDRSSTLVRRSVEQIAAAMHTHGRRLPKAEIEQLTTTLLPGRGWSSSLLNGLLKEAILSDLLINGVSYVRFGYERLGDIAWAKLIAAYDLATVTERTTPMAQRWYHNAGVLQALASVLPETHGVELIDVLSIPTDEYHPHAHNDFLLSIAWRMPDALTDRTETILVELRANPDVADAANNALLQVATVPGHRFNAEWLHRQLRGLTLLDRDVTWSHTCDWQHDNAGHLPNLISWAWSDASTTATEDTRHLAALTLSWALGASHRPTRDNATKAIIALLEPAPHLFGPILKLFADCGDDAIEERLLAVACSIAQRACDRDIAATIAEAVRDHTISRDYWPQNYLSRDYARRTIDAALEHGWQPNPSDITARVRPPYTTDWIAPQRSRAEIDELAGPPAYRYSAVKHPVMSDIDDFRKHVMSSLVHNFQLEGEVDADYLGRIVFDQVLHLGWTPELFDTIDRNLPRAGSAEGKQHEGYARKYLWTAFKQLAGRVTDRFALDPTYRDDNRTDYQTPLDVYGHDIDPTTLLRRTENRVYADTPPTWFAPAAATFPVVLDPMWATHDEHAPPVEHLLACTNATGERWLVLEGHYQWSQPQTPDEAAAEVPHHRTWTQIRSYLVNAADIDAWATWAQGQDWNGRWMPESGSPTGLILADHPYKSDWPNLEARDRTAYQETPPPGPLVVTTTRYGGVANDWDQSDSKHLYTFMPSTPFCQTLDLQRVGDFQWGRAGIPLAESFAAREPGPDTVHVAAGTLRDAVASNRMCLLWTVLAEKDTVTPDHQWPPDGHPVSRTYSATYLYDGAEIRLLSANAHTICAGGDTSNAAAWSLPPHIPI